MVVDSAPAGASVDGAGTQLFAESGCVACHAVSADVTDLPGPTMVGVAGRSQAIIQDPNYTGSAETVEAYLRESILEPDAYLTPGFAPIMPKTYQTSLSRQEVDQLVDYLMALDE